MAESAAVAESAASSSEAVEIDGARSVRPSPSRWKLRRARPALRPEPVAERPDSSQAEVSEASASPVDAMPVDTQAVAPFRPEPAVELDAAPDPPAMEEEAGEPVDPPARSQPAPLPVEVLSDPVEEAQQQAEEAEPSVEPELVTRPIEAETPPARDLPIHEWVEAAEHSESDPAWPQELVRIGLERSRRRRDVDRADQ